MSKWTALVEDYLKLVGDNPRSAHVVSTVADDTALQLALEQAAKKGQQNRVFAEIAGTYEMPTVDRAASAYANRGRQAPLEEKLVSDPNIRGAVGEFSPGFAARMERGDVTPDEVLDVYGTGPLTPRPTPALPDGMPRMPTDAPSAPLAGRVARVRGSTPVDDILERLSGVVDVAGPPAAYRQSVRVRPSRAGLGSGAMDTTDAARAMEVLAPSDLGTSLADTGALGPAAQQIFGVSGPTRSRQVGSHGGGRVFGDVTGPAGDFRVQVAGPNGVRSDILPGSGATGNMLVGEAGDVIGPSAITQDMVTPGGFATVDDAVGPAGAWEGRRGQRAGRVMSEDVVFAREEPDFVELPPEELAAPVQRSVAPTPMTDTVPGTAPGRQRTPTPTPDWSGDARRNVSRVAAGAAALAAGRYMLEPLAELEEPPAVASPEQVTSDAVAAAIDDLRLEDDLEAPAVVFDPLTVDAVADIALPPAADTLPDIPELLEAAPEPALEPMAGQPVGVSPAPVHRRLKEIRDFLQRGGSEDRVRNNPRYADIDEHMREMAILRGRDLGARRDRTRLAMLFTQGGRVPNAVAGLAAERFFRMNPDEQQDFLAAGQLGESPQQAARAIADRQAHRRKLEEIDAQGKNQAMIADRQGEWGVRGAEVENEGKLGVAGIAAEVDREGQKLTAQNAAEDRKLRAQGLTLQLAETNAKLEQATREGNANRAAQAKSDAAHIKVELEKIAASDRQATAANNSRERVAETNNPAALDPAEALQRAAIANATPTILQIIGRSSTRSAAYSAIKRDPVANQAPARFIENALDQYFPR
jgi:hypothetical protein